MKPINAWVDVDLAQKLEDYGVETVYSSGSEEELEPVTILPGHLAESLRWRRVGEEEPEADSFYVVNGLDLCWLKISSDTGRPSWVDSRFKESYELSKYDVYRPAIAGIDYPIVNEQSTNDTR